MIFTGSRGPRDQDFVGRSCQECHDSHPKGSAEQHHHRHHRLSGAFHVGNGWEWGLLGLLFMVVDWISNPHSLRKQHQ